MKCDCPPEHGHAEVFVYCPQKGCGCGVTKNVAPAAEPVAWAVVCTLPENIGLGPMALAHNGAIMAYVDKAEAEKVASQYNDEGVRPLAWADAHPPTAAPDTCDQCGNPWLPGATSCRNGRGDSDCDGSPEAAKPAAPVAADERVERLTREEPPDRYGITWANETARAIKQLTNPKPLVDSKCRLVEGPSREALMELFAASQEFNPTITVSGEPSADWVRFEQAVTRCEREARAAMEGGKPE